MAQRGASAMAITHTPCDTPNSTYAHCRCMRSQIQPPARQPAADTSPAATPVTSATVSADAFQSPATADHRPDAAPEPTGRRLNTSARKPRRERATCHRSFTTLTSVRPTVSPRCVTTGSGTPRMASIDSRHVAPSTAPGSHACSTRCAIIRPMPPPMPEPPRLPAWNQPLARPFSFSGTPYASRLSTAIARNVTARLETSTTAVSSGRPFAVMGSAPVAKMPSPLAAHARKYHPRRVQNESEIGAHRNFHVWGM